MCWTHHRRWVRTPVGDGFDLGPDAELLEDAKAARLERDRGTNLSEFESTSLACPVGRLPMPALTRHAPKLASAVVHGQLDPGDVLEREPERGARDAAADDGDPERQRVGQSRPLRHRAARRRASSVSRRIVVDRAAKPSALRSSPSSRWRRRCSLASAGDAIWSFYRPGRILFSGL